MKNINVGVVGVGIMGQHHLRIYSQLKGVKIVGVCDVDPKNLQITKRRFPAIKIYSNYDAFFKNEELDIISVSVPTSLHYQVTLSAIKHTINTLVEKPFTLNAKEGRKLIQEAKKRKVLIGVGHVERFNPVIKELKKKLMVKRFGKPFQMMIRRLGPYPNRTIDVGVYLDLATHDLDILSFLTGAKIVKFSTQSSKIINPKFEDLAISVLKFDNGIIGMIAENWLSPTKIRDLLINCEKGMFLADLITQDLYFYENNYSKPSWETIGVLRGMTEGKMIRYQIKREEPLKLELESFVRAVSKKIPFGSSAQDGLNAVNYASKLARI